MSKVLFCGDSHANKPPPYARRYNLWRLRILVSIILGYATFYFCRQNFNIAMPALMEHFNATKTEFGLILTIASIVYGLGKFFNGFISDKSNARHFMSLGLALVGIVTIASGFCNNLFLLGILWIFNNWFQSMGWPPASRMLTHWFSHSELGLKWALGSTANQIGGAASMLLCGYLLDKYDWNIAFFIPGIVAVVFSLFLFAQLRDSPMTIGLPVVETYKECEMSLHDYEAISFADLVKIVFCNKLMWYSCIANMFVYIVRFGIIFWAPLFLSEIRGLTLFEAGSHVAMYEILGIAGAIASGWISDRLFSGNRGGVGGVFMLCLGVMIFLFWQIPNYYNNLSIISFVLAGFFVSGPQVLIGVATAEFTSKQLVGTANGFAGLFGYFGSALAGVSVGVIAENFGWDGVFIFLICSAFVGAMFFFLTMVHNKG